MTDIRERRLGVKELLQLAGVLSIFTGLVTSIVAYIHADVTVPKILNKTSDMMETRLEKQAEAIERRFERHESRPHAVSPSKNDLQNVENAIKEDLQEWKKETRTRLDRIERKL